MIAKTTLNKLREHSPCTSGWKKLLAHLGKVQPDDVKLPLSVILESNGLDDALWALRAARCDRESRLFACDCAQSVAHLNPDPRVQASIDTARRFADRNATREELAAAGAAARAAARAAIGNAAGAAAWNAAWNAAGAAAGAAAGNAAWNAAGNAAGAAAWNAARAAAWAAAWDEQKRLFITRFCTQ